MIALLIVYALGLGSMRRAKTYPNLSKRKYQKKAFSFGFNVNCSVMKLEL